MQCKITQNCLYNELLRGKKINIFDDELLSEHKKWNLGHIECDVTQIVVDM